MEFEPSQETRQLLQRHVPVLHTHGVEIALRAYQILFTGHPEVRTLFSSARSQPQKLGAALTGLIERMEQPSVVESVLGRIVAAHTAADIPPESHRWLAEALQAAFIEVTGEDPSSPLAVAWREFVDALAAQLAAREAAFRDQQRRRAQSAALGFVVS